MSGPPGIGKTTTCRLVAELHGAYEAEVMTSTGLIQQTSGAKWRKDQLLEVSKFFDQDCSAIKLPKDTFHAGLPCHLYKLPP